MHAPTLAERKAHITTATHPIHLIRHPLIGCGRARSLRPTTPTIPHPPRLPVPVPSKSWNTTTPVKLLSARGTHGINHRRRTPGHQDQHLGRRQVVMARPGLPGTSRGRRPGINNRQTHPSPTDHPSATGPKRSKHIYSARSIHHTTSSLDQGVAGWGRRRKASPSGSPSRRPPLSTPIQPDSPDRKFCKSGRETARRRRDHAGLLRSKGKKHTPGEASRLLPPEIKRESKSKSLPGQKAEGRAAGTQLHPGKAEAGSALPISLAVLSLSISLSLRI